MGPMRAAQQQPAFAKVGASRGSTMWRPLADTAFEYWRQRCRSHRARSEPASKAGSWSSVLADGRQDAAGDLAEADPAAAGAGCRRADRDLVIVVEEGAAAAVGELDRVLAVPGVFDQRADRLVLGPADRARGEEVAGPQAGSVGGQVGQLLRRRPVHAGGRRPGGQLPVQ